MNDGRLPLSHNRSGQNNVLTQYCYFHSMLAVDLPGQSICNNGIEH